MGIKQKVISPNEKQSKTEKIDKKQTKTSVHTEKDSVKTRNQQKKMRKEEKRKVNKPRRRMIPIWLRLIIILILAAGALTAGLMVGYGVIGDGDPKDALLKETWQHIVDIVKKEK